MDVESVKAESGGGVELDNGDGDTLESVANNFMLHVQRTEEENSALREDKQRLYAEIHGLTERRDAMEQTERRLEAENTALRKELSELTGHHQDVKDENTVLLTRLAEARREKEAAQRVHEDLVSQLQMTIHELEQSKSKLTQKLADMDESMRDFNQKLDNQSAVIKDLRADLAQKNDKSISELETQVKHLKATISEKEDMIEKLQEDAAQNIKCEDKDLDKEDIKRLQELLKARELEIKHKDEIIEPLDKERSFLSGELSKVKEDVKSKAKEITTLQKKIETLTNSRKSLEKTIQNMKTENSLLRSQQERTESDRDEEVEQLEAKIQGLNNKIEIMKTTESALAELLKSKEHHLCDLRSEVTELRNISNLFQRDLEELRSESEKNSALGTKYEEMSGAHKRVLDENKRLRTMFATRSMEDMNSVTERSELKDELETTKSKLRAAQDRVDQLENWMDQIFKNPEYDIVLKNGLGSTTRDSIVSLPEISKTRKPGHFNNKKKGPPLRTYNKLRELPGKF